MARIPAFTALDRDGQTSMIPFNSGSLMSTGAGSAPYSAPLDSESIFFSAFSPGVRALYRPLGKIFRKRYGSFRRYQVHELIGNLVRPIPAAYYYHIFSGNDNVLPSCCMKLSKPLDYYWSVDGREVLSVGPVKLCAKRLLGPVQRRFGP